MLKRVFALLLCVCLMAPAVSMAAWAQPTGLEVAKLLLSGDAQAVHDMCTQELKTAVSVDTLAALVPQLSALLGSVLGVNEESVTKQDEYDVHVVRIAGEDMDVLASIVFDAQGRISGLNVAPAPQPVSASGAVTPNGILEQEITVDAGQGFPLGGTLTMPKTGENFPAVVFVHGSGSSDRDEHVGQTYMFRDLAWGLAQAGIASVRYDKRTYTYGAQIASSADYAAFTVREETILDAIAAGELLQNTQNIDHDRIYVVGHSMGAMLAPRIVFEAQGVFSGMALLSGSPYSLIKVMYDQNLELISALEGDAYAQNKAMIDAMFAKVDALKTMTVQEQQEVTVLGLPGYYVATMQENTVEYIERLKVKTLIINGDADFQVRAQNGYDAFKEALEGTSAPVTIVDARGLNHMLMRYQGEAALQYTTREYDTPATVDQGVVDTIAVWVFK